MAERHVGRAATTVIGIGAGILSGFLGVGGGILMVPAMVLFFSLPQHQAHATSLAVIVPIAGVALISFAIESEVSIVAALLLAPTSIVGALLGARLMRKLDESLLRAVFGLVMIIVAISMIL
jgi:uncharacterized membrane protein YfcA